MLNLVVLISGSGSNLRALLEAASDDSYPAEIVAVGADNAASGLAHAVEFGVPTFVVAPQEYGNREAWGQALAAAISEYQPDLVVCAGFMRILPADFVGLFSPQLINMHPALLPLYPGAHAVRDALADGATVTGASVHIVDEGVDTGPVIEQVHVAINADDTEESLHERIKAVERELIVRTVKNIATENINLQELAR
ncbi:phosphoribosylglycinamide formyltransferase [Aurantimicrobium sp. MWH-Uga1]|uniref:phosphoribosylglycinamide formyltransferase n=1 Tax=Aurantimicrobium sp. MWH-Uga1 TaxID=2079575 RepID=UPI000DEDD9F2|nr:phosphoribosylglycinamide formyltransferase [Aurantimicrobium sp. MWH-Uga1]AXE55108.1 Phosphoribosylglycinamide formyltransferase [Aurantimicrobium sp. MWH-Uga1]